MVRAAEIEMTSSKTLNKKKPFARMTLRRVPAPEKKLFIDHRSNIFTTTGPGWGLFIDFLTPLIAQPSGFNTFEGDLDWLYSAVFIEIHSVDTGDPVVTVPVRNGSAVVNCVPLVGSGKVEYGMMARSCGDRCVAL